MGMRKYLKDYRLDSVTDKNGKTRTVSVYCGSYHAFVEDRAQVRACARAFSLLALAQAALAAMALFTNALCGHIWYVMVPFALVLLPLFLVCAGAVNLLFAKEKFTRETNDHIADRTRLWPVIAMILSGISALAHIPYAVIYGETAKDAVYLAAALGIFATALAQKRLSAHFVTREQENPNALK